MRTIVMSILLAGASAPAAAEEWFYVADDGAGIVFADADSVWQADGAIAVLGFLGSYAPLDEAESIYYEILRFEFICSTGQYRVTHTYDYDIDRRLARSTDEHEDWAAVPAESFALDIKKFACEGVRIGAAGDPFEATDAYFEEEG